LSTPGHLQSVLACQLYCPHGQADSSDVASTCQEKEKEKYAERRGCIGWFPGSTENWKKGLALSSIARLKFEDLSLPECSTKFYLQNST